MIVLIAGLEKKMRDLGNTHSSEHDEDTMREADYLIDAGPVPCCGEIVAAGTPKQVARK